MCVPVRQQLLRYTVRNAPFQSPCVCVCVLMCACLLMFAGLTLPSECARAPAAAALHRAQRLWPMCACDCLCYLFFKY